MQHKLHAAILAVALASASCATNSAGNRTEVDTLSGRTYTEKGDTILDGRLTVTDIRYRDNGGLLQVQATIQNKTTDTLQCEVNAKWYDASGWELQTANQPWLQVIVHGLEHKEVVLLSPRPNATRIVLVAREDNAYRN
jgi:uncharacterized protein YcfL